MRQGSSRRPEPRSGTKAAFLPRRGARWERKGPFRVKARKWPPSPAVVSGYKEESVIQIDFPEQGMDAKTDGRAARTPRVEDDVLVRGKGRYAADVTEPGQAYAYFARSPHAFARIVGVDIAAATEASGVLGVLTAKDMTGIA